MLLIDAANVVGSRPDGWWRDRPGAAQRLVEAIAGALDAGRLEPPVVVVLEGAARRGMAAGDRGGVTVVHASGSGDDELVARAASEPGAVVLVSADRGLRHRVAQHEAAVVGPSWLFERLSGRGGPTPTSTPTA